MSLLQRKDVQGAAGRAALSGVPDPELVERLQRRRFTSEYKLRILREVDGLSRPGEVGALLRHDGLYSSRLLHLAQAARPGRPGGPLPAPGAQAGGPPLRRRTRSCAGASRAARQSLRWPAG